MGQGDVGHNQRNIYGLYGSTSHERGGLYQRVLKQKGSSVRLIPTSIFMTLFPKSALISLVY